MIYLILINENKKIYSISAMRYESICFLIHPTGYALLLLISYTLGHLDKSHCHQCFCIQMLISAKCILWHNEQDIELVVVNDFLYKLFLGEDFFLMGFCKALSCCCCDINSAVMNIWKSWKTKQTKNLAKILIDLHVY